MESGSPSPDLGRPQDSHRAVLQTTMMLACSLADFPLHTLIHLVLLPASSTTRSLLSLLPPSQICQVPLSPKAIFPTSQSPLGTTVDPTVDKTELQFTQQTFAEHLLCSGHRSKC